MSLLIDMAIGNWILPFLRLTSIFLVAPVFGSRLVPGRVRILLAMALSGILLPAALSTQTGVAVSSIGLPRRRERDRDRYIARFHSADDIRCRKSWVVKPIASTMGLGFATMVDPQRGITVPVLSQFYLILTTLLFLSFDGHHAIIVLATESFALYRGFQRDSCSRASGHCDMGENTLFRRSHDRPPRCLRAANY